jgi:hypothetical protein
MIWVFLKGLWAAVPPKYILVGGLVIVGVGGSLVAYHKLQSSIERAAISKIEKGNLDAKEKGLDAKDKALQDYDACLTNDGKWNRAKLVCESP